MTALLVRVAQANNIHLDGDGHQFPVFEAEMRRRLWQFCVIMDIRTSEDRGSHPLLYGLASNINSPTPIDDDAFGPDSTSPLIPHSGPSENVITLAMGMSCAMFELLMSPHNQDSSSPESPALQTEQGLLGAVRRLETTFIHTAEPHHRKSQYAAITARLVILRLWLGIQYPVSSQPVETRPRINRETMLQSAVSALELSEKLAAPPFENWRWLSESFVQWHPLAVALSELCIQTEGPLVANSWKVVDRSFTRWREMIADTAKGNLWKPIRKLLKRAKAARAAALMKTMSLGEPSQPQWHQPQPMPYAQFAPQGMHQHTPQQMMTPMSQQGMMMVTPPYDSLNMDPSYLFEYPTELRSMEMEPPMVVEGALNYSPWAEFLHDTMVDEAGVDSGDSV